jgi:hypothetical protein
MQDGRRDFVMLGAFLGDATARKLVPDTPQCGKTFSAFIEGLEELPWEKKAAKSCYHFALLRCAIALGRAVLPKAMKMNASEAAPDVFHTTEAYVLRPEPVVRAALERLHFFSAPPTAPREFQFQYRVAEVAFSPFEFERVAKSAAKILGQKTAFECVVRELRARIIDDDDPIKRSIGERLFLALTLDQGEDDAVRVDEFPRGWEKTRALEGKGEMLYDIIPNSKSLFLVSAGMKALLEKLKLSADAIECKVNGKPVFWMKPKETFAVLSKNTISPSEFRFLEVDAQKCKKVPTIFFLKENPQFVVLDTSFFEHWRSAGLKGLQGGVLPFGAPLKSV